MQSGLSGTKVGPRLWGKLRRSAVRVGDRARGVPIRLSERARGYPVPPARLLHTIGNSDDPAWFLRSGRWAAEDVAAVLARHDQTVEALGPILDFGCGVGRVIRHWAALSHSGLEIQGSDSNVELIAWCRRHLDFARFAVNPIDGRIAAADNSFGLAYAFSVFTHLSEPHQHHWMRELFRVLRPGGFLLFTLHGAAYRPQLSPEQADRFDRGELVVLGHGREGSNHVAAFHPLPYVVHTLIPGWTLYEYLPVSARGNPCQDICLLRKPEPTPPAPDSPVP